MCYTVANETGRIPGMVTCEKTMVEVDVHQPDVTICPFVRKTSATILSDLAKARQEIVDGRGIPADAAMTELGARYGFI